jgi:hypothetical protein
MDLTTAFSVVNWLLIFGAFYWAFRTVLSIMTYLKPSRLETLALSVIIPLVSIRLGFITGFLVTFIYLLIRKLKVGPAFSIALFSMVLFFVGAAFITIAFGVAGTALHVPGYEMHGTLRELVERVYG